MKPKPRRRFLWFAVGLAVLAVIFLVHAFSPSQMDCPSETSYDTSVLVDYCTNPSDSVTCVLSAEGLSPTPYHLAPGVEYSPDGALGPWCSNATPPR